ncbi:MAG: tryptophan synthase subunit alpha [Thermodesulfobacteriota bacterium]|nr:tryptophan synthase subunit alpha [Thermodesulfobacteriota bacterium]MEE2975476.1 tryptophan synthase subunit alpha [Thermodesulfobacteriota bacterium]
MKLLETIEKAKQEQRTCLVTYVTAGDPDASTSLKILEVLSQNGSDIIELGIPFSDPISDGPTIQKASERALSNNVTISSALSIVKKFRTKNETPIILFGYYNPFLKYGLAKIMKDIKKSGGDGILIVDLPPEESYEAQSAANKAGIELIYLIAPTSTEKRIKIISELSNSFIYLVSVTGVTGARKMLDKNLKNFIKNIKNRTKKPICVGFGISNSAHINQLKNITDGIIIGSAIIKKIEKNINKKPLILKEISKFILKIKKATYK